MRTPWNYSNNDYIVVVQTSYSLWTQIARILILGHMIVSHVRVSGHQHVISLIVILCRNTQTNSFQDNVQNNTRNDLLPMPTIWTIAEVIQDLELNLRVVVIVMVITWYVFFPYSWGGSQNSNFSGTTIRTVDRGTSLSTVHSIVRHSFKLKNSIINRII